MNDNFDEISDKAENQTISATICDGKVSKHDHLTAQDTFKIISGFISCAVILPMMKDLYHLN